GGGGVGWGGGGKFVGWLVAAVIGVISPSGNEVGPFVPIEQAALSQLVPDERRTGVFAWYNLIGSVAAALGSLCGGMLTQRVKETGLTGAAAYRPGIFGYAAVGILPGLAFLWVSPQGGVAAGT